MVPGRPGGSPYGPGGSALRPRPCYIRYNAEPAKVRHEQPLCIGRAEVWREGQDVTLITYGLLFGECLTAASLLAEAGWSVGLVNMRMLKPADSEAIVAAARRGAGWSPSRITSRPAGFTPS